MELTELCQELKNWFELKRHFGNFTISGGSINVDFLQNGQYYRIVGSVFNDGVHRYPSEDLVDETFDGAVWAMAIPPSVIALMNDINEWEGKYGEAVMSPYNSESFGGYSYTKSSGVSSGNGGSGSLDYRIAFADKLNRWRKV